MNHYNNEQYQKKTVAKLIAVESQITHRGGLLYFWFNSRSITGRVILIIQALTITYSFAEKIYKKMWDQRRALDLENVLKTYKNTSQLMGFSIFGIGFIKLQMLSNEF